MQTRLVFLFLSCLIGFIWILIAQKSPGNFERIIPQITTAPDGVPTGFNSRRWKENDVEKQMGISEEKSEAKLRNSTLNQSKPSNSGKKPYFHYLNQSKLANSDKKSYFQRLNQSKSSDSGKKPYFQYSKKEKPSEVQPVLSGMKGYLNIENDKPYDSPRCESCALVSSSGQLISSRAGADIDAHDCVVRMNVAPVKGFERDVGNKSTIRFVSHTSVPFLLRDKNNMVARDKSLKAVIAWGPNDERRRQKVIKTLKDTFGNLLRFVHVEFYAVTQDQLEAEDFSFEAETGKNRDASGSFLSTGWFTISFMRKLCGRIDIYGMVNDDYCKSKVAGSSSVPYHYWESSANDLKECATYLGHEFASRNVHRFITEKTVFHRWAQTGAPPIRFFHPDWS